jgi:hypothetical protein
VVNIRWCAGRLSLRERHRRGKIGAADFDFAPGSTATVRVKVRSGRRRSIKRAARNGGVKMRARAVTSSGSAAKTLRLR